MLPIKETKEMLGFVLDLGNALGVSLEDGKVTILDLHNFVQPLLEAGAAFDGAASIPSELASLDAAGREELLAYAKKEFDIPEECVETVVEEGLTTLAQLHKFVQTYKCAFPAKV